MQKLTREQAIDYLLESTDNVILCDYDWQYKSNGERLLCSYGKQWTTSDSYLIHFMKSKTFIKLTPGIDTALLELKKTLDDAQEKLNKLMERK